MSHLISPQPPATVRQTPSFWYIVAEYPDDPDVHESLAGPFLGFTDAEHSYVAIVTLYYLLRGHSLPSPEHFTYYRGHTPHTHPMLPAQWMNPLIGLNEHGAPLLPEHQDVLETLHHTLKHQGPVPLQPQWLTAAQPHIAEAHYTQAQEHIRTTLQQFESPDRFWSVIFAFEHGVFHPFIDYALAIGIPIAPAILQHIFQERLRLTLVQSS